MKHSTEKKYTTKTFVTKSLYELQFGNQPPSKSYVVKYGKAIRNDKSLNGKKLYQ